MKKHLDGSQPRHPFLIRLSILEALPAILQDLIINCMGIVERTRPVGDRVHCLGDSWQYLLGLFKVFDQLIEEIDFLLVLGCGWALILMRCHHLSKPVILSLEHYSSVAFSHVLSFDWCKLLLTYVSFHIGSCVYVVLEAGRLLCIVHRVDVIIFTDISCSRLPWGSRLRTFLAGINSQG